MPTPIESRGLRLLALDGGGVRGLSALLILQQLMATIDPESPSKPCDYFDMIGGTSTGGLIAIMLGRLQMTVEECIIAYTSLSDKVFEKKAHRVDIRGRLRGRFDSAELERVVKQIMLDRGINHDVLLKDSPDAPCKVFVCTTSKETGDTVCLTSYRSPRVSTHLFDSTKIWQACRATSAATTFFDSIAIGPFGEEFVDGALGANNPINALWNQAQDVWGDRLWGRLACLVSIGTGIPALTPVRDDVLGIWSTLKDLATETEITAEQFRRDKSALADEGRYVRFNVDRGLEQIGLEESKKKKEIAAATGHYLASQVVFRLMQRIGSDLRANLTLAHEEAVAQDRTMATATDVDSKLSRLELVPDSSIHRLPPYTPSAIELFRQLGGGSRFIEKSKFFWGHLTMHSLDIYRHIYTDLVGDKRALNASVLRDKLYSLDGSPTWPLEVDDSFKALQHHFPVFHRNIVLAFIYVLHMRRDTSYKLKRDQHGRAILSQERLDMVARFDEWILCDCPCGSTWNFARDGGLQDEQKNNRPCLVAKWLASSAAEKLASKAFPSQLQTGQKFYFSTLDRWQSIKINMHS